MFGGKNAAGELQGKLRYLKPTVVDGKVTGVDFVKIRQTGTAPCGRTGHTMGYLPQNQALLVVGGRNDDMCRAQSIPFLNDMHLFLLDQKMWLRIKYIPVSGQLCSIGNHAMAVAQDEYGREKVVIFGGITDVERPGMKNGLSNQTFTLEIAQVI